MLEVGMSRKAHYRKGKRVCEDEVTAATTFFSSFFVDSAHGTTITSFMIIKMGFQVLTGNKLPPECPTTNMAHCYDWKSALKCFCVSLAFAMNLYVVEGGRPKATILQT